MSRGRGDRGGRGGRGGNNGLPFAGRGGARGRGGANRGRGTFPLSSSTSTTFNPAFQPSGQPQPFRGGRGGDFRGRGRGRANADFTEVAFDYSNLTAKALGFEDDKPDHQIYAERAFGSGHSTPRGNFRGRATPARGAMSTFSDRGRAGGLGFHRTTEQHTPQTSEPAAPMLKFVKAQTSHGFESKQPGDLEDQIDDGHSALKAFCPPQIVHKMEMARVQQATESLSIVKQEETFVIDTLPSPIKDDATSSSARVLGLGTKTESRALEEETSEGEEIVFKPRPQVIEENVARPTVAQLLAEEGDDEHKHDSEDDKSAPPQKLSKSAKRRQKKEGKKARRNGVLHARSGNAHLGNGRQGEVGVSDMLGPREGSDIDWGSDGPPSTGQDKTEHLNAKGRRKKRRAEQREREKLERLSANARRQVDESMRDDEAADDDYAANLLAGGDTTIEDLKRLSLALDQPQGTLEEADASSDEVEGWETTSDSDSESEDEVSSDEDQDSDYSTESYDTGDEVERDFALGEADAAIELALAEVSSDSSDLSSASSFDSEAEEDALMEAMLSGQRVRMQSMGDRIAGGGRKGKKEKRRLKKGKGKALDSDSADDTSSDDEMFDGSQKWYDDDEYLDHLQAVVDQNIELLQNTKDRKARKQLFKAIESGNFDDFDDDALFTSAQKPKGKKKKPMLDEDDAFMADLQDQWERDRAKKSAFKRARQEARLEGKRLKKQRKMEQKRGSSGNLTSSSTTGSSDAAIINDQIRNFIMHDIASSELALPPMSKKSRVAVHLLAEIYGLKSRSTGKGNSRFPVLERTSKTTVAGVQQRRIDAIIGTARGERSISAPRAKGKMGGLWAALADDGTKKSSKGSRTAGGGARQFEGHVVGQGADKIGQDNVGYALLKKMGWSEGGQIGLSGGLADPIAARIKTTRSGLGSGYSLSRTEAQSFAFNSNSVDGRS